MFNSNQIKVVREYLEKRFNTMNVTYIKSGASGILFQVNEFELVVIIDTDYNVTLGYTKYDEVHTIKGGYSLGLLENALKETECAYA
jgi:hypothetical protein